MNLSILHFILFATLNIFLAAGSKSRLTQRTLQLVANGQDVLLKCPTNDNTETIKVVKWFKDGKEFCRYYPKEIKTHVLNSSRKITTKIYCEGTDMNLGAVSLMHDGDYNCKVYSAATKKLKVTTRSVSLLVYPMTGPVISGLKERYLEGETILGNCTAAPSNPPPSLIWYINGVPADGWSMFTYPCQMTDAGLCVLRTGLRVQASRRIFASGIASFVCESTILALPGRRAFATAYMQPTPNFSGLSLQSLGVHWMLLFFIFFHLYSFNLEQYFL